MPADFELTSDTRTVHSRAWGALTDADLLDHSLRLGALFRAGDLGPDWAQISDFTAIEHLRGVSSDGIRLLAERNPWPPGCIRVGIVTTDEQYGLIRMYQALGGLRTEDIHIVRSLEEADAYVARQRARVGLD